MTRFPIVALVALTLLVLRPAVAAGPPFAIDVILPLTGPAAFAGKTQEQAVRVYEMIVNKAGGIHGQPVHFEIHDDQSNPLVDVQIVNDLLPKHPLLVLGPSVAATCAAIAPLFANGPVNFCFSPALMPARGGYVFAASTSLHELVAAGYGKMRALGYKRLGVLIATDASGQVELQATKDALALPANKSLQLVALESYAPTAVTVAAQVAKLKAAKPDIIYVWSIGSAFGTAIRELHDAGLSDVPVVTSPSNTSGAQLAEYKSFLPATLVVGGLPYQGKLTHAGLKAAAGEYLDNLKEAGVKAEAFQAYAWDPIKIAMTALQNLPAGATAAQLRDAIAALHGFPGLFGVYDFRTGDQHGLDGGDVPYLALDTARNVWGIFDQGPPKG